MTPNLVLEDIGRYLVLEDIGVSSVMQKRWIDEDGESGTTAVLEVFVSSTGKTDFYSKDDGNISLSCKQGNYMLRYVLYINNSGCVSKKIIRMTRLEAGRPVRRIFFPNIIDKKCLGLK
jgi:hypothetical protein